MTVRSVRNKNPGNLRIGQPWLGLCPFEDMTPEQAAEKAFCVFKESSYGFRALAKTLLTYFRTYKLRTANALISRFAPANENDTRAYVLAFANALNVIPLQPLDLEDYATLHRACRTIAIHEAGGWLFDNDDLDTGVDMALGITQTPTDPATGPLAA